MLAQAGAVLAQAGAGISWEGSWNRGPLKMSGHLLTQSIAQQRDGPGGKKESYPWASELTRKPEGDLQTARDSCRLDPGYGHWSSARCLVAEGVA